MKKIYCTALCALLVISCSKEKEKDRTGKNIYTMEMLPGKTFLLDENTTQETNYIQLATINDTVRFTMYNKTGRHSIVVYDMASGKMTDYIPLYVEGPNNVGANIQGYCICTMDSIYLYDYWQYHLIQVNRKGEIVRRIDLREKLLRPAGDCIVPPSPYPRSDTPIRMAGDNIILQGMDGNSNECEYPTCMVTALYNIGDSTVRFANPYPEVYGNHKNIVDSWGVFSYREVFYDLNRQDEMIVSFPADDHLVVYDIHSGRTQRFFAGHSREDRILPLQGRSMASERYHYLEQTQYIGVFFDRYRNLYYRLVGHPLYDYDLNDRATQKKRLSVIILDNRFNKVGEYDLDEQQAGIYAAHAFVSEEGLHINVASDDDDYLKFITLKPVKL